MDSLHNLVYLRYHKNSNKWQNIMESYERMHKALDQIQSAIQVIGDVDAIEEEVERRQNSKKSPAAGDVILVSRDKPHHVEGYTEGGLVEAKEESWPYRILTFEPDELLCLGSQWYMDDGQNLWEAQT